MEPKDSRRKFLAMASAAGFGALVTSTKDAWGLEAVANPLASYPDRGWEHTYRDLWKYDSKYTFTCAPNDTHNCLLNAYVRQGVITRIGPTMRYGEAFDLSNNHTTSRWDPRVCQKGLALTRRFYGDRRVNQCMHGRRYGRSSAAAGARFHQPPPRAWNRAAVSAKRAAWACTRLMCESW